MIPRETYHALPETPVRLSRAVSLSRLREAGRTATRLLRKHHLMHQPINSWPHNSVPDTDEHDCLCWLPDDDTLLLYDPASETSEAWLFSGEPVDLRDYA